MVLDQELGPDSRAGGILTLAANEATLPDDDIAAVGQHRDRGIDLIAGGVRVDELLTAPFARRHGSFSSRPLQDEYVTRQPTLGA